MKKNKTKDYFLPISIILAGLIIAGAVIYSNGLKIAKQKELSSSLTPAKTNFKELNLLPDDPVLGDKNAPLTLFEFSNYQCPYCGRFHQLTRPEIVKNYVEKGKVKMVFRDFPFHQYAQKAAEATWCAKEQGKYWEMQDFLFLQAQKSSESFSLENLLKYAKDLKLDPLQYSNCLNSGKYSERVNQSAKEAQSLGIGGTPTIIIAKKLPLKIDPEEVKTARGQGNYVINLDGGVMIIGAQAYLVFQTEIDKLLQ